MTVECMSLEEAIHITQDLAQKPLDSFCLINKYPLTGNEHLLLENFQKIVSENKSLSFYGVRYIVSESSNNKLLYISNDGLDKSGSSIRYLCPVKGLTRLEQASALIKKSNYLQLEEEYFKKYDSKCYLISISQSSNIWPTLNTLFDSSENCFEALIKYGDNAYHVIAINFRNGSAYTIEKKPSKELNIKWPKLNCKQELTTGAIIELKSRGFFRSHILFPAYILKDWVSENKGDGRTVSIGEREYTLTSQADVDELLIGENVRHIEEGKNKIIKPEERYVTSSYHNSFQNFSSQSNFFSRKTTATVMPTLPSRGSFPDSANSHSSNNSFSYSRSPPLAESQINSLSPSRSVNSVALDADTYTDPNTEQKMTTLLKTHQLKPIYPRGCWRDVFIEVKVVGGRLEFCNSSSPARVKINGLSRVASLDPQEIEDSNCYYGDCIFSNTENWQPLFSLGWNDQLLKVSAPEEAVFRKNTVTGQNEFKLASNQQTRIQWFAKRGRGSIQKPEISLPESVKKLLGNLLDCRSDEKFPENFRKLASTLLDNKKDIFEKQKLLINYCKAFLNEKIEENPCYLNALQQSIQIQNSSIPKQLQVFIEQKGSCRHRAFFFALFSQYFGIPAIYVSNDIHAFACRYDANNGWLPVELGGAATQTEADSDKYHSVWQESIPEATPKKIETVTQPSNPVKESKNPPNKKVKPTPLDLLKETIVEKQKEEDKNQQKNKQLSKKEAEIKNQNEKLIQSQEENGVRQEEEKSQPASEDWGKYFCPDPEWLTNCTNINDVFDSLKEQAHRFCLTVKNVETGRAFYQNFSQRLKNSATLVNEKMCYVESLDTLSELIKPISCNKSLENNTGFAHDLLYNKGGILVINLSSEWKTRDICRINSLYDTHRTYDGRALAPNCKVFFITTEETIATEDFYSRARPLSLPENWLASLNLKLDWFQVLDTDHQNIANDQIEDCFNDETIWSEMLGSYSIKDDKISASMGKLARAIENGNTFYVTQLPTHSSKLMEFLFQLEVNEGVYFNGKLIKKNDNFKLICLPKELQALKTERLSLNSNTPTYYLNSQTFSGLTSGHKISEDGKLSQTAGWLGQETSANGYILITDKLSQYEENRLAALLEKFPNIKVGDIDNCEITLSKSQQDSLIVCEDSAYRAELLHDSHQNTEIIKIHQESDFFNGLAEQLEPVEGTLTFSCKEGELLKAIKAGKTVILEGQLSENLYRQLESIWGIPPILTVGENRYPLDKNNYGKIIVVTPALDFRPFLAEKTEAFRNNEISWETYKKLASEQDLENFEKLKQFYEHAKNVSQVDANAPAPRLSAARLRGMLQAMRSEQQQDNPIKPFLLQDYEHDSEAYAFLNVLAKLILAPNHNNKVEYKKKYKALPDDNAHQWRRANCLSAQKLRELCPQAAQDSNQFYSNARINQLIRTQISTVFSTNAQIRPKQAKDKKPQIQQLLEIHPAVLLKGPPGSGKTYTAKTMVDVLKTQSHSLFSKLTASPLEYSQVFYWTSGDANTLSHWRDAPASAKNPAILVVDEANTYTDVDLSVLKEYLHKRHSPYHHIILTANEETQHGKRVENRHLLPVLQDLPTVYLGAWSNQQYIDKILSPLSIQNKNLIDLLLKSYRIAEQHLFLDPPSARNLRQMALRALKYQKFGSIAVDQAVKNAAFREFEGLFFDNDSARKKFLAALDNISTLPISDLKCTDHTKNQLKESHTWLCPRSESIIASVEETIDFRQANEKSQAGVLLEGDSGFGKSHLMRHLLLAKDYQEIELKGSPQGGLPDNQPKNKKYFFHFTVDPSESTIDYGKWLRRAFFEGWTVIIDELNLDASIEKLLGQLLTGTTPEGEKANKPGFFVIATQNNSRLEGRQHLSPALKNRLHVYHIKDYDHQELVTIANVALPNEHKNKANSIVSSYEQKQAIKTRTWYNSGELFQGLKKIISYLGSPISENPYRPLELMDLPARSNGFQQAVIDLKNAVNVDKQITQEFKQQLLDAIKAIEYSNNDTISSKLESLKTTVDHYYKPISVALHTAISAFIAFVVGFIIGGLIGVLLTGGFGSLGTAVLGASLGVHLAIAGVGVGSLLLGGTAGYYHGKNRHRIFEENPIRSRLTDLEKVSSTNQTVPN